MKYLALTQGTAEWLLPKVTVLDALHSLLPVLTRGPAELLQADFVEGPIRVQISDDGQIIAVIHTEYVQGTGEEFWGFIRLTGEKSLESFPHISREVLERSIYVINQRLRGLLIDGAYYHKKYENGAHTLLAGRGSQARYYSIAYVETISSNDDSVTRSLISLGPDQSWPSLATTAEADKKLLPKFSDTANSLLSRRKPSIPIQSTFLASLRAAITYFTGQTLPAGDFRNVQVVAGSRAIDPHDTIKTMRLKYSDWESPSSPLNETQRRILNSDVLKKHPLRVIGPAGSGKTLLMQLLAIRTIYDARSAHIACKILYVVHSEAMRDKVVRRFELLAADTVTRSRTEESFIQVTTLAEYCRTELQLEVEAVLDRDASDAKIFQLEQVGEALAELRATAAASSSSLLHNVFASEDLMKAFAWLTLAEISTSIKGFGLEYDKKQYVESERNLSRFHGILGQEERSFVFEVFQKYHHAVFESYSVLDPDDIALSLAGRLRTPVWELRRRSEGFDYLFVDEAQLFNENERRVLPLLTRTNATHVPIALALDEAQSFYGQPKSGLATLGIKDVANENLMSIHRSTSAIAKLAFFVIQKSTDLFGADFPSFTQITGLLEADKHTLAAAPRLEVQGLESSSGFSKFILRRVRALRKENTRQIAIICHSENYWGVLESDLPKSDLPFQVLRERGERIRADQPVVVLCRPAQVGGQEFDAVIIVGLELGLVPPRVPDNQALAVALEQQSIREVYLSITRARYRVIFCITKGGSPNHLLQECIAGGMVA